MADKKITELTALTSLSQDDLFVVVDDPEGIPITKRITAGNIFANVNFSSVASTTNAVGIKVTSKATTANISSEFIGAKVSLVIANAAVTQLGSGSGNVDFYGLSIEHSNTVSRLNSNSAPIAFFNLSESANATSANAQLSTTFLMDLGRNGLGNVSFGTANSNTLTMVTPSDFGGTAANSTPTHKIKIRINGTSYWLLASNTAN